MAAKLRTTVNDPRLIDASIAELEISYLFLQWEEDHWFYRWERMLGLVWTPEDLEVLAKQSEAKQDDNMSEKASQVEDTDAPSVLRYPLSLLVRPELLKNLQEHALPSSGGLFGMGHVPKDATSLYGASKEDFLRRMGATAVKSDFDGSNVDSFAPSQRPREGFAESAPRTIGRGRK